MHQMARVMNANMEVKLRNADEADKPFLLQLRKQTMTKHLEAAGLFLGDADHAVRVNEVFDCARIIECSGERLGLAKYRETDSDIEILQLQVLPEHQGKGIGRSVMESLIEKAVQRKKRLVLTVLKANPARRLYDSLGFRVIGEDEYEFHMRFGE